MDIHPPNNIYIYIYIPSTVQAISGAYINNEYVGAFENNTNLVGIKFTPDSQLSQIGSQAFFNCTNMSDFQAPNNLKIIGNHAFENVPVNDFNFDSIIAIGDYAFAGTNLTSLDFSNCLVETIGNYAFANCKKLEYENVIWGNIQNIGSYAFYNAFNNLKRNNDLIVNFYNTKIQQIGDYAFSSNDLSITNLLLPPELNSVGNNAFSFANNLSISSIKNVSVENLSKLLGNLPSNTKVNLNSLLIDRNSEFYELLGKNNYNLQTNIIEIDNPTLNDNDVNKIKGFEKINTIILPASYQGITQPVFARPQINYIEIGKNDSLVDREQLVDLFQQFLPSFNVDIDQLTTSFGLINDEYRIYKKVINSKPIYFYNSCYYFQTNEYKVGSDYSQFKKDVWIKIRTNINNIEKPIVSANKVDLNYFDLYEYLQKNNKLNKLVSWSNRIGIHFNGDWYSKLTDNPFELDESINGYKNFYCTSEAQALFLYSNNWGNFFNVPLHKNIIPPNVVVLPYNVQFANSLNYEIRGSDFEYMEIALSKAHSPSFNLAVWHGVEFMETEFYDQLQNFITYKNGKYDYSECVGKIIQSYGFISTSTMKNRAMDFAYGLDWTTGPNYETINKRTPPLKSPACFKIKIPKNTNGVGYVSGFPLTKQQLPSGINPYNTEGQYIVNRNARYLIDNIYKEGNVIIFDTTLLP